LFFICVNCGYYGHLTINCSTKSKPKEVNVGPQTLNGQINGGLLTLMQH